ncbi:ORC1-type DNA replication protein 1 [Candidatus Bilamarchaeum dharawalense]|uniref:ORC1-type DNA replication protein n=1 Tax=Candidatus Bilamarchaeum dharawalense TaxID=2885759 RepID=A0A5E4LRD5_9ARCH|nr:ORC1-type DNA replication protein 1 [Candidatus Bilamarchaeum dharawalense]
MVGYFDDGNSGSSIIRDEKILLPDYLPDELIQRDHELQYIADCIKPLLGKRMPQNLFIHGSSGTGKTTCVRYLIRQLSEQSSSILPVYVNCWENPTQLAIYNKIVEEMRLPLPRRGLAADEIFDKIMQFVKNYKKPILLVLDEMDAIRHEELLYVISRSNEKMLAFGIIGISNNKSLLSKLDQRIRSSLRFSEMEFQAYSEEQLSSILRLRAERALEPASFDEKLLLKIARSVEDGSARVAIERLWKAAKNAEHASKSKIMIQDLEDILSDTSAFKKQELNLSPEESFILELLKSGELGSTELYTLFSKKYDKSKRQIRYYIDSLEQKKLIESNVVESGSTFKSRIFKLMDRK